MDSFENLPKVMIERAFYARKKSIEDPKSIQLDDNLLPWIYCEEDDRWYSFSGNYSNSSPEEKIRKKKESLKKSNQKYMEMQEDAYLEYKENLKWTLVREDILERDGYKCQLCGKKGTSKLHIHHILKRINGGENYYDQLLTVCPKCHSLADRKRYNPSWEES